MYDTNKNVIETETDFLFVDEYPNLTAEQNNLLRDAKDILGTGTNEEKFEKNKKLCLFRDAFEKKHGPQSLNKYILWHTAIGSGGSIHSDIKYEFDTPNSDVEKFVKSLID
jgi:hypothetical protein